MNSKLKILLVESDKDTAESIIKTLGEEFYIFEIVENWDDTIIKILDHDFDIIILNYRLWNAKENAISLLEIIEKENAAKLKSPYIILLSSLDSTDELQSLLYKTPYKFVFTDAIDNLYELEWSIINLVPKIFYKHKKELIELDDRLKNFEAIVDKFENNLNLVNHQKIKIERLEENHLKFEKDYVSWRSITESLGNLVGGFSVAIGIIVAFIAFLAQVQEKFSIGGIEIPFVTGFILFMIVWSILLFLFTYRFVKKNNR